jgi:hypothetical protein
MRIFLILFMGFLISQELQVEGDLNVTGTIESVTIDSLNQVILELQNQIAGMQVENRLETRVFTTNSIALTQSLVYYPVDIQDLIGLEIEHALINVLAVELGGEEAVTIDFSDRLFQSQGIIIRRDDNESFHSISIENRTPIVYTKEIYETFGNYILINKNTDEQINITLTLAITAQFPN